MLRAPEPHERRLRSAHPEGNRGSTTASEVQRELSSRLCGLAVWNSHWPFAVIWENADREGQDDAGVRSNCEQSKADDHRRVHASTARAHYDAERMRWTRD